MNVYQEELYHHGVLGMKWGVRRYQNPDGSYTAAGRKRYGMDLDINDKSRQNIAKIRTGEAKRRLDVAKANNSTNNVRLAELQGRVRSAKQNEKNMKRVDKGAKRMARGETITSSKAKRAIAIGTAALASAALTAFLNSRAADLSAQGRWTPNHQAVAELINKYGSYTAYGLAGAYNIKKMNDEKSMRAFTNARIYGDTAIKSVGSEEYADVLKRRKQK